jgi:hypothetical protein
MSRYLVVLDGARAEHEVQANLIGVRDEDADAQFTLLVPADRRKFATEGECWLEAAQRANHALETLKALGLDVAEAVVGDFLRRKAISDEVGRGEHGYDAILLFTVPYSRGMDVSRIVPADIESQLERRHRLPVRHIAVGGGAGPRPDSWFTRRLQDLKYASLSQRN